MPSYLDPGERLDDPDEVLLQQVVVQFGQVGADDGIIPQLRLVVCEGLEAPGGRRRTLTSRPSARTKPKTFATRGEPPRHQPFRSRPATGSCWPARRISASPSAQRNPRGGFKMEQKHLATNVESCGALIDARCGANYDPRAHDFVIIAFLFLHF